MSFFEVGVFLCGLLGLLSGSVLGLVSPYQCFDGRIVDNDNCNQYDMSGISPFAGKFVRLYTDSGKTTCLQDTGEMNGYSAVGGTDSIMTKVASGPCDPNKMYYVLPDGNADGKTGTFALWGYDFSSKSSKGPLMTDGSHPLPKAKNSVSLRANQLYLWGDSPIPYFSWSGGYSQDSPKQKRSDQYGDNAKWFKWYPHYYYDGPGGGNAFDPSRYMSVYLWHQNNDYTLTGRITQIFNDGYYSNHPKSDSVSGDIGKLAVCRAASCYAVQTYNTIWDHKSWSDSGAGSWCNEPCGENNKYIRPWIDVNGKYRCPYTDYKGCKDKGNCEQIKFQYLTGWVENCYSGSYNKNGSVPTNAGILTGRINPQEDRPIIGDFSEYIELEEVPLRYNPLYLSDLGNVCSPANLQKAGWTDASTCPFQSVAGVGGSNLNGNLELVVPPSLDGMPFLQTLTVLANPRQGFASMRIDFYQPDGFSYPTVSTGDPSNLSGVKQYTCSLDPLEIITEMYLLPKLVGDINRRTILGLKWKTNQGKSCTIPSEWQDNESVWQSALKLSANDLAGGIPVGLVFNRVQDDDPLDPFSATKNYIGQFGLVFYRTILEGLSEGSYTQEEYALMAAQLNKTTVSQEVKSPQTCRYNGTDGYFTTCTYTATTTSTVKNTYTNSYSYSNSASAIQTLKTSKSRAYNANAGFKISLWKFSAGASTSWDQVQTGTMEAKTDITSKTTQDSSQVSQVQTDDKVECKTTVTASPTTPSVTVTFMRSQGTFSVPWEGNYSLVLEGGAKFDFTARGQYDGDAGSTCWFQVTDVKAPPTPPPPPLICPKGDSDCFCSTHYLGLYPDYKSKCRSYYQCYTKSNAYLTCPSGQLFDQNLEECAPADEVNCVDPSVPQPPSPLPSPLPSPPPPSPVVVDSPPPSPAVVDSPPPSPVVLDSPPPATNQTTTRKLMASLERCSAARSSCFNKRNQKFLCECPDGLTCRAMLTYKRGEVFRCQQPLTEGRAFLADVVKVKNSKCKEFVTMDLRWWPNLKSIAERCNVPQYCLITANTELLKKYARPDGTFLPKMKGKRMNIGCFHRSMY